MICRLLRAIPKWVCTSITVALILWLTLAPHPTGNLKATLFPGIDKIVHAIMFGWLTLMLCLDIHKSSGGKLKYNQIFWAATISSGFGVAIEYLQLISEWGRSFEISDMIADIAGAAFCATILTGVYHSNLNRLKSKNRA